MQLEKDKQKELQAQLDQLKEENRHLREEYEKYKIRTNYLMKSAKQASSSTTTSVANQEEIKRLKQEVDQLKMRCVVLDREKQDEHEKLKSEHENSVAQIRNDFRQQLDRLEASRLKSLNDLEKELVKQRDRTFKLLAEKDSELEKCRNNVRVPKSEELNGTSAESSIESSPDNKNFYIIPNGDHSGQMDNQSSLIYYSQQNAYKDTELNKLRQAKISLEYKLKQTIDENSVDADRYQSQIELLKQEIERLKLNSSRVELNGANLEYIKNVVFNYMTTKDSNIKTNLTNSLVQILHFTKAEKQRIHSVNSYPQSSASTTSFKSPF
jgi:hypothetical protein